MVSCCKIFDFRISIGSYEDVISSVFALTKEKESKYVCVANVHMFIEAYLNSSFLPVVNSADIVTTDGKPLTWALYLLLGIKQDRVAGLYLMKDLLVKASTESIPVFFYGGSQKTLDSALFFLNREYPRLKIAGLISPPFRTLNIEEEEAYADIINKSGAKIVFVSLGCPKQEQWMSRMKGKVNAVMIGIGAALPVLTGERRAAPFWVQNIGLEWFFRLCIEPRRLFKRYLKTNSIFLYILFREVVKNRFNRETTSPS